ncbi:MAG: sulfatase-like hydrolase/transferase, partial [Myxococcota bacterium]|nr:sulfatase-like hydrolase/transferase [Myxococcota bacterium]
MSRHRSHLLAATLLCSSLIGCAVDAQQTDGPAPMNIILISIDTLRADRLGAWGNPDGLTPNLDRFARESTIFRRCYAQSNETLFSHASLLTSRYPSELGSVDYDFSVPKNPPTLAEVLQAYGYRTAAFTGGGQLRDAYHFHQGFERFQVLQEWGSLFHSIPSALEWIDQAQGAEPFFTFIHGYDPHPDYLKPPPFGYGEVETETHPEVAEKAIHVNSGTLLMVDGRYYEDLGLDELVDFSLLRPRGVQARTALQQRSDSYPETTSADQLHVAAIYDGAVRYADA